MDHLPYPQVASYSQIKIPYLESQAVARYSGDNFIDFPKRAGWQSEDTVWYACEPGLAAARAQAWLFFGLLIEVLGPSVTSHDFTTSDVNHNLFVSTKDRLPRLLRERFHPRVPPMLRYLAKDFLVAVLTFLTLPVGLFIRDELRQKITDPPPKLRSKTRAAMVEVEKQVRTLDSAFPKSEEVHLVCLSIRTLLWSLRNAAANRDFSILMRTSMELSGDAYLEHLLVERGWCPHKVSMLASRSSVATLHYLSGLQCPVGEHQNCTKRSCTANILDPSKYETKHVHDDCRCALLGPDPSEIRALIDKGDVPLIRATPSGDTLHLEVQHARFEVPYVAISHVWSGGLGNQTALTLPTCQLHRICKLLLPLTQPPARNIERRWYNALKLRLPTSEKDAERMSNSSAETCLFWMDTLCLPKERPQRDLAIGQMTRVYAGAHQVVILDKDLQSLKADTSEEEVLANVVSSSWMSRCWTFQEGRLARHLLMHAAQSLRDPFVAYNRSAWEAAMFEFCMRKWDDLLQLRREMASSLYVMRPIKDDMTRGRQLQTFADVWNELVNRTTSWPEDEITILTLMLDLSVHEVKQISTTDMRVKAILRTQPRLPVAFLFQEATGRHPNSEEDWVPQDLTRTVDLRQGSLRKMTNVGTEEPGFLIRMPAERLTMFRSPLLPQARAQKFVLEAPEQQSYHICMTTPEHMRSTPFTPALESRSHEGKLYVVRRSDPRTKPALGYSDRGCRFSIIEEDPTYVVIAYEYSFSYTVIDAADELNQVSQPAGIVDSKLELRLKCGKSTSEIGPVLQKLHTNNHNLDWTKWPALTYQRSTSAALMTTSHGPTHPIAVLLWFWEWTLGLVACAMVIVVFPNADEFSGEFWFTASPAEWTMWGLCIIGLIVRMHIAFRYECPALNKLLKAIEYRKWTESFDQPAKKNETRVSPSPGMTTTYQYRSWWIVSVLLGLSIALLVIGLTVDRPNLYDLALVGGYLLVGTASRVLVEVFWKYSGMKGFKQAVLDFYVDEHRDGFPNFKLLFSRRMFSTKYIKTSLQEPSFITHGRSNLDYTFEDPMYLPEDYTRMR